ncbi:MAG: OB-fold putative lipoprotein [Clostridiales Family XIII bacterium]|jgi:hypothetical protein|nr:OB-fold putative lipoprotein [Clostridiales Family XIII bacterium]
MKVQSKALEIEKCKSLLDDGVLSKAEYKARMKNILEASYNLSEAGIEDVDETAKLRELIGVITKKQSDEQWKKLQKVIAFGSDGTVAAPQKKKGKGGLIALIIVAVIIVIIIAAVNSGGDNKDANNAPSNQTEQSADDSTAPEESAIQISAKDLMDAYDENEVAADEKYKGKVLQVKGVVNSVATDIMDELYVTLDNGAELEIISVQCYFNEDKKDAIAKLKKGDEITIEGTCTGYLINVLLEDCDVL